MNSQKAKIGPGFETARPDPENALPGSPKWSPGAFQKCFCDPKMGDAYAVSNPAVLIQRALVPKMVARVDFDKTTLLTNLDFLDLGA